MSTAAKVARAKREHPEQYCPHPRCLWRTGGGYCPRHKPSSSPNVFEPAAKKVAK